MALIGCSNPAGGGSSSTTSSGTVSLAAQSGTITAGIVGSATFAVTTANIANGTTGSCTWYTSLTGGARTSVPTGVTPTVSSVANNAATVTMTAGTSAVAGAYYFAVSIGSITSGICTLALSSTAVSGTVTVDIGSISGTPTIQLEQNSVVIYTLPYSLASGPPEVMTLTPTTIIPGTYDIVITINPSASITTAGTSAELNGTGIGGITVAYAGAGYAPPDTITIPSVVIQTNATLTIVLDHYSGG